MSSEDTVHVVEEPVNAEIVIDVEHQAYAPDKVEPIYEIEVDGFGKFSTPSMFGLMFFLRYYDTAIVTDVTILEVDYAREDYESSFASDVSWLYLQPNKRDTAIASEDFSSVFDRVRLINETALSNEVIAKYMSRELNEVSVASDVARLAHVLNKGDEALASESYYATQFDKNVNEISQINETLAKHLARTINETSNPFETVRLSFGIKKGDNVAASESYYAIGFNKSQNDTSNVSDVNDKGVHKASADEATASSQGLVTVTDYALDYFGEDFVGEGRNFD